MTTGPAHWELLQRARAVDNQMYVAAVSPARNPASGYQAWGHSTLISPWGDVVATCDHEAAIVIADVDLNQVGESERRRAGGERNGQAFQCTARVVVW